MMIKFVRFNTYLCAVLGLLFVCGCESLSGSKKKEKEATIVELHLEVNPDGGSDNGPVQINRDNPFSVNVDKTPFVDTTDVVEAGVVDDLGGFLIKLKFNWRGTALLDSCTTGNRGKRIAVYCKFGKARWIASPVIRKRISDGVFTFTPDVTREEADRIVKGLNNVGVEVKKSDKF
jgi:preprotein translocase subunit SecD